MKTYRIKYNKLCRHYTITDNCDGNERFFLCGNIVQKELGDLPEEASLKLSLTPFEGSHLALLLADFSVFLERGEKARIFSLLFMELSNLLGGREGRFYWGVEA